jgi:hypothetical protein
MPPSRASTALRSFCQAAVEYLGSRTVEDCLPELTAGIRCDEPAAVSRLGEPAAEKPALELAGAEGAERVRLVRSGGELPSSPAEGCCLR